MIDIYRKFLIFAIIAVLIIIPICVADLLAKGDQPKTGAALFIINSFAVMYVISRIIMITFGVVTNGINKILMEYNFY
jgi:hypothetical protein